MKLKSVIILFIFFLSFVVLGGVQTVPDTAEATSNSVQLPVLMYHSILNSRTGTYTISSTQFENDLIAIKKEGYNCVFPSEVIAFVKGKRKLPQKPIMITFDDGYYNTMYYALPLLRKYNMKASLNVIGAFSEYSNNSGDHSNPSYSHVTWSQIKDLVDSGCFEIGNHTYNMHKFKPRYGIMPVKGEDEAVYKEKLINDISHLQKLLNQHCNLSPNVFAYPFGRYSDTSKKALLDLGFEMLLTCNEGINTITVGDIKCLHNIKRYNRKSRYTSDCLMALIATPKK